MDKTLAWLWLADAVGSGCQYAQELLTLYPDPAELYDACVPDRGPARLPDASRAGTAAGHDAL